VFRNDHNGWSSNDGMCHIGTLVRITSEQVSTHVPYSGTGVPCQTRKIMHQKQKNMTLRCGADCPEKELPPRHWRAFRHSETFSRLDLPRDEASAVP